MKQLLFFAKENLMLCDTLDIDARKMKGRVEQE